MAIEDYVCSLLLSSCGHALLATGNGLIASCDMKMLVSLQFTGVFLIGVLIFHASHLKRIQYPDPGSWSGVSARSTPAPACMSLKPYEINLNILDQHARLVQWRGQVK